MVNVLRVKMVNRPNPSRVGGWFLLFRRRRWVVNFARVVPCFRVSSRFPLVPAMMLMMVVTKINTSTATGTLGRDYRRLILQWRLNLRRTAGWFAKWSHATRHSERGWKAHRNHGDVRMAATMEKVGQYSKL